MSYMARGLTPVLVSNSRRFVQRVPECAADRGAAGSRPRMVPPPEVPAPPLSSAGTGGNAKDEQEGSRRQL